MAELTVTHVGRADLLRDPYGACAAVISAYPLAVGSVVCVANDRLVMVEFSLAPVLELACHGYPRERARIVQDSRHELPSTTPVGPTRRWHHRNPDGTLCLWYPHDPEHRSWNWGKGFVEYIAIAHRHLMFEESFRRGNPWPAEDAPHGHRRDGRPHPFIGRSIAS